MRKILLATTALAAFAGFSSAANAQITVTLGGYTEFFGAIYDNNLVNGTEREFQLEAEIVVKADGKADNGLLYGTKIELQTTGTGANGAATNVGHRRSVGLRRRLLGSCRTGRLRRRLRHPGDLRPAGRRGRHRRRLHRLHHQQLAPSRRRSNWAASPGAPSAKNPDSSDATKVMYLTPRFAGFQAGFSYTPENGDEAQASSAPRTPPAIPTSWNSASTTPATSTA